MTQFCDASNHNDLAPTKQNLLCQGRSAKDVIFSHSDLTSAYVVHLFSDAPCCARLHRKTRPTNETLTQSHLAGHFDKNWPGTEARPTYETLT